MGTVLNLGTNNTHHRVKEKAVFGLTKGRLSEGSLTLVLRMYQSDEIVEMCLSRENGAEEA